MRIASSISCAVAMGASSPDEFAAHKAFGESLGIQHVEAGPLVRSSYRAGHQVVEMLKRRAERAGESGARQ